VTIYIKLKLSI